MARSHAGIAVAPGKRPRGSLSREEILEAGLLIAKRDELTRLTMKKLAGELGVTPMAIYRHFENKAEVIDGVLDLFVRDAAVADHEVGKEPDAWRRWTLVTFGKMFDALTQTPGVMPFLSTTSRFGPAAMSALNAVLEVLRRAGMSEKQAVDTFAVLCAYTIGAAGLATAWSRADGAGDPDEERRRMRLSIEATPRSDFPNVVDAAADLAGVLQRFPFQMGLERLLRRELPD
ncbi:MAG: TetR/AcrR family transcriptional regulator [Deltaproteobacteria bacterium]|nr:TetR/AcrR family transcriptional regulator [Deltaproteobacteria bacterium]MBW2361998.1 TetR/AcrR family transcriptional regulator [Deltaproteobacteria bacterium]